MAKPMKFVEGWSESTWKSLAIKAVRIGWLAGLQEAALRMSKSDMKALLIAQAFEDVFPAPAELPAVLAEIKRLDYRALCQRDTRHAVPGLTEASVPIVLEWVNRKRTRDREQSRLYAEAKKHGVWLSWRALAEFDAWLAVKDTIPAGRTRSVDETPWTGMPKVMVDLHCWEGKQQQAGVTLLSGVEAQHVVLAQKVQAAQGWDAVRAATHAEHIGPPSSQPMPTGASTLTETPWSFFSLVL